MEERHRYHLANQGLVSQKKEFGGLGVSNLRETNMCLLASWIKRYELDAGKLWRQIIDFKYDTRSPHILCSSNLQPSPFWKGVVWAMQAAKLGYWWNVGNGRKVRFWQDQWFGTLSWEIQYWEFYVICNKQNKVIAAVWDDGELKLSFRRTVNERLYNKWMELVEIVSYVNLSDDDHKLIWKYNSLQGIL